MHDDLLSYLTHIRLPSRLKPTLWGRACFGTWLFFHIGKASHRRRLKVARKLLIALNGGHYSRKPHIFFGYIRKIDPLCFEELLLLCFKARGFKVFHNHAYTGDGGVDGQVILPDGRRFAIQAKRYQGVINPAHVKVFATLITHHGFDGGFFIHTGRTTRQSYAHVSNSVVLISGDRLHRFITSALRPNT